jgi:hypothetical protein
MNFPEVAHQSNAEKIVGGYRPSASLAGFSSVTFPSMFLS